MKHEIHRVSLELHGYCDSDGGKHKWKFFCRKWNITLWKHFANHSQNLSLEKRLVHKFIKCLQIEKRRSFLTYNMLWSSLPFSSFFFLEGRGNRSQNLETLEAIANFKLYFLAIFLPFSFTSFMLIFHSNSTPNNMHNHTEPEMILKMWYCFHAFPKHREGEWRNMRRMLSIPSGMNASSSCTMWSCRYHKGYL